MSKVLSTTDYSIFKKHESNRELSPTNIKTLKFSIQAANMLEFRPILVDSDMRIIDGQHRLEVAKQLNIPIYYQINIDATHEDIMLLNNNQKRWVLPDYIHYYISRGNQEYGRLDEFCKKHAVLPYHALSVFGPMGESNMGLFKRGNFKFPDEKRIEKAEDLIKQGQRVIQTINAYCLDAKPVAMSTKFRDALYKILTMDGLNVDTLCAKIVQKFNLIRKCPDIHGYYCMLRDIYNWNNRDPIG